MRAKALVHLASPRGRGGITALCGRRFPTITIVEAPDETTCPDCLRGTFESVLQTSTVDPKDPPRSTGGKPYCSKCGNTQTHWPGCPRWGLRADRDANGRAA